jgi:hypothetical protein
MKIAIIGSRNITIENIKDYIPSNATEIVSGGAKGVDTCAAEYATQNKIKLTVFLPNYTRYGKGAPLKRNSEIAEYADSAIAFWDGSSKGTLYTINEFKRRNKSVIVIIQPPQK